MEVRARGEETLMKFNPKRLPITSRALFTIVGGAVLVNPVFAQDQDQTGEELDTVVVTGIRGSLKASMNMKREATGVVDAINAEDIGKFPDTNLAESLQRIPGVSINREGGEGKYVTVRGFGPRFNVTTLDGRQLTSENINRDFEFDTLGSEMISALVINKTGS